MGQQLSRAIPVWIIRDLALVLTLFVIVPAVIIYALGLPNGLISTLIYMQLLVIWIQVELSIRQQYLFRSQFAPIPVLSRAPTIEPVISDEKSSRIGVTITVRNLSDNPGFNIKLIRVVADFTGVMNSSEWGNKL